MHIFHAHHSNSAGLSTHPVHELAHALLLHHGSSDKPRNVLDLEAESGTYIVYDSLRLDTSAIYTEAISSCFTDRHRSM